ncbi:MAG: hypothetical protein IT580_21470, partial [Verrucomicrobiales bacterium]|nr:hypothetical protein [Verrucomicrobiales bacterium]
MPLSEREVQEQLRTALDKDWLPRLLGAVQRVPSGMAPLALDLLGVDADGRERTPAEMPSFFARAQSIANLSAADRQALFEGLFPGKGAVLEGGWQLLRKLPYRNGYPWRCPVAEAPGLPSRLEWLTSMTGALGALGNRPLSWYAVWHGRTFALDFSGLGVLLAAGMDLPGTDADELAATVQRVLQGGDEIGRPTRELIRACLHTRRPGMSEFITQHLLTAGREEGLREMILGCVDSSRAEVLPQFARLILDHGLARFSSTIQAFNEWFGFPYDAPTGPLVNPMLQQTLRLLEDPAHRASSLGHSDAQTVFLALWAQAFEDIGQLQLDTLDQLLAHPQPGQRLAAATLAANLDRAVVSKRLIPRLADEDWRVVRVANEAFLNTAAESIQAAGLFDALAALLDRMPAKLPPLKPLLWPWETHEFSPDQVLQALLANPHTRSPALAEPYVPKLSAAGRALFAEALANFDHHDAETQRILTRLLPDPSPEVRAIAARALRAQSSLDPALAPEWEGMLKRKTGEVREHALALLVKLSDAQALESADRLLSARDALTRTGGLELLRQLVAAGRVCEAARQRVEAFQSRVVKVSPHDQPHVDSVLSASVPRLSLEDALGLAPTALRTPPLIPRPRPGPFASPTSRALAAALEVEVEKQSATRFRLRSPFDDSEFDADLAAAFSHAAVPERASLVPSVESRVPLRSTWMDWLRQRGPDLRDPDGFELLRLLARKFARWRGSLTESALPAAERQRLEPFFGPDWAKSDSQKRWATDFMPWLLRWDPPQGDWPGFVLDGYESTLALIHDGPFNHSSTCSEGWLHVARLGRVLWPERWRPAHHARLWRILRWRDDMAREGRARITLSLPAENPRSKVLAALQQAQTTVASDPCWRGSFDDGVAAFATGGATEADLLDLLLSNRETLRAISQRPIPRWLPECPALRPVLARATERLLEIELARGDIPTPATRPCLCLRSLEGMSAFARLLAALGDQPFERQSGAGQDRRSVFSDLLGRCHPAPDETPERFARFIKDLGLTPERLVEAAVFAPQWARHVETATAWSGLAQGIAWIHAHTKVADSDLSPTDQATWKAEMAQHSPLSGDDLMDGAVDVTWFQRLY